MVAWKPTTDKWRQKMWRQTHLKCSSSVMMLQRPFRSETKKNYFCFFARRLSPYVFWGFSDFLPRLVRYLLDFPTLVTDTGRVLEIQTQRRGTWGPAASVSAYIAFPWKCFRACKYRFAIGKVRRLQPINKGSDYGINPRKWNRRRAPQR